MLWPMVIKCEGHKPSCSLSCLVGWEQIYSWWTAVSHKQPLLHVWITYNCFFFPFKCLVVQTNLIWSGLFGTDMQDVPALFQLVRCSEFFYLIKWILVSMLSSELIGLGAHCYLACHSNWTCSDSLHSDLPTYPITSGLGSTFPSLECQLIITSEGWVQVRSLLIIRNRKPHLILDEQLGWWRIWSCRHL